MKVAKGRMAKSRKKAWKKSAELNDSTLQLLSGGNKKKEKQIDLVRQQLAGLSKEEKARMPCVHELLLVPHSDVPDPVAKRYGVKTKERTKKTKTRKTTDQAQPAKGVRAPKDKLDVWSDEGESVDTEWLGDEARKLYLVQEKKFKIKAPPTVLSKPSPLAAVEAPHPGTSYNPSFTDHQALVTRVAEAETQLIKKDEHLRRVTTDMFSKMTQKEKQHLWFEEMSAGLVKEEPREEDLPDSNEYKAVNPPTTFEKRKTRKQRNAQKRLREERVARARAKVEKKKLSDVYRLRLMGEAIQATESKQAARQQVRAARRKERVVKRVAPKKFEEPPLEFCRAHELSGNLRNTLAQGSILADRFTSLQKRNMLAPTDKRVRTRKAKVKRFVRPCYLADQLVEASAPNIRLQ